jgi:hypothetical protein
MNVSSLRLVIEPSPLPSQFHVEPPAIYVAPDRYEIPNGALSSRSGTGPTIYVGDTRYVALPVNRSSSVSRTYVVDGFALSNVSGLTNEQTLVFDRLLTLREGVDFQRTATGYRFRILKDQPTTSHNKADLPTTTSVVHFVGGTVTLHDGYVRQVTVNEETSDRLQGSTVTYSAFEASSAVHPPASFTRCSAISPKSPNGGICRALEQ